MCFETSRMRVSQLCAGEAQSKAEARLASRVQSFLLEISIERHGDAFESRLFAFYERTRLIRLSLVYFIGDSSSDCSHLL